jgi:predicted nucleic acid-binding protein
VVVLAVTSETAALSETKRGEILRTVADTARSRRILRRLELLLTPERFVPREAVLERTGLRR